MRLNPIALFLWISAAIVGWVVWHSPEAAGLCFVSAFGLSLSISLFKGDFR